MLMNTLAAMALGLVLNMMVGKPQLFLSFENHMISTAKRMEKFMKRHYQETPEARSMAGSAMVFFMLLLYAGIPLILIILAYIFVPVIGIIIETILFWFTLNIKSTRMSAYRIMRCVRSGRIEEAQKRLSKMTGKDCSEMDADTIIRATIEKVSDRCVNGGFSPIFYMTIFGGFGAVFYKTVCVLNGEANRNKEDYVDFGNGIKTLWNILGYIPARIGSVILKADVRILSLDIVNANKVFNRDHKDCSPEFLGQARSIISGALDIQLVPEEYYDGRIMRRRTIGEPIRPCEPNDIYWTNQLFYGSVFGFFVIFAIIRLLLFFIF
ncbi:MAG: cobalamin biosynthesis protein [Ruminococcus sp.]|nr:cobalamin biosynthesis protein [Ruminococcus sp.]